MPYSAGTRLSCLPDKKRRSSRTLTKFCLGLPHLGQEKYVHQHSFIRQCIDSQDMKLGHKWSAGQGRWKNNHMGFPAFHGRSSVLPWPAKVSDAIAERKIMWLNASWLWVHENDAVMSRIKPIVQWNFFQDYKSATNTNKNDKHQFTISHWNSTILFKVCPNKPWNEGPLGISGFELRLGTAAAPSNCFVPESKRRPSRDRRDLPPWKQAHYISSSAFQSIIATG